MNKGFSKLLIILITFVVTTGAILGVTYYLLSKANGQYKGFKIYQNSYSKLKKTCPKPKIAKKVICPSLKIISHAIVITPSKDQKSATISDNGTVAATITSTDALALSAAINVRIFKQTAQNLYLGVTPDGIGGYILYDISQPFYRLSLDSKHTLTKLLVKEDGYITDISPDETKLVYITPDNTQNKIILYDLTANTKTEFLVDAKYQQAGTALISPDQTKIAYAAAIGNSENEKGVIFMIDIATKKQTGYQEISNFTDAPQLERWINNTDVVWN